MPSQETANLSTNVLMTVHEIYRFVVYVVALERI